MAATSTRHLHGGWLRTLHLLVLLAAILPSAAGDAPAGVTPPTADSAWAPVEQLLRARMAGAPAALTGMGLVVYDQADQLVFTRMVGDFAPERMVAIASASKLVSGLLLFDVIATSKGALTLESTTGEILPWSGPAAAITLRHLLSFTSGLANEDATAADPRLSLADCVAHIAAAVPKAAPGLRFDYGSTHLQVAARMAEVVTGRS